MAQNVSARRYDPRDLEGRENVGLPVPRERDTAVAHYYGAARYWERAARELGELPESERAGLYYARLAEDRELRLATLERVEMATRQRCRQVEQAERERSAELERELAQTKRALEDTAKSHGALEHALKLVRRRADAAVAARDHRADELATLRRTSRRTFLAGTVAAAAVIAYLAFAAPLAF